MVVEILGRHGILGLAAFGWGGVRLSIAANHLLGWRKSRLEAHGLTFEMFGKDLEEGLSDKSDGPDQVLSVQEIRVGCTLGMLLCLDRPQGID
jgi:hypothetical protein